MNEISETIMERMCIEKLGHRAGVKAHSFILVKCDDGRFRYVKLNEAELDYLRDLCETKWGPFHGFTDPPAEMDEATREEAGLV